VASSDFGSGVRIPRSWWTTRATIQVLSESFGPVEDAVPLSTARLEAIPWTRVCVVCADGRHEGGSSEATYRRHGKQENFLGTYNSRTIGKLEAWS